MIDLVSIGKVKKTVGVNGNMNFYLYDEIDSESLTDCKYLFFDLNGSKVPFKVDYLNLDTMQFRISEDSLTSSGIQFVGTKINIEAGSIIRIKDDASNEGFLKALIGYKILLKEGEEFGEIVDYIDYGTHLNLEVKKQQEMVHIPFHEDFVIELKDAEKILILDLPEGF